MIDTAVLWVRAEAAMRARRFRDAAANLRELIDVVDRIDFEYEEWLRAYGSCLRELGEQELAIVCAAYLGHATPLEAEALEACRVQAQAGDAAALRALRLRAIYLARRGDHVSAAEHFRAASLPIHAAIELERSGDDARAVEVWSAQLERPIVRERRYEYALIRVNLALALGRMGHERARQAIAEATTAVEEVADSFETEGLRERAFDCYQLLARVGVETDSFENIAEGFLNSVRILRDDALKLDALRLYEAFVTLARRAREHHAVAQILREAADYSMRVGLPYAEDLRLRAGDAWVKTAMEAQTGGLPQQIVENALVAAAEDFASVRAFRQVAEVYGRLSTLEGSARSRDRYRRLLDKLGDRPEDAQKPVAVPEFLRQMPDYEEVWYVDLAEWELEGDAVLITAGIMGDRRFPDYVRRHALLLVLDAVRVGGDLPAATMIERLQAVRAYPVIAAFERLYATGDADVQRRVAHAMGSLRFKRSFGILEKALRSDVAEVRERAAEALKNLFFPHAFDRLRRLYDARDLPDGKRVRIAAIGAIGSINTPDAVQFLCDRLRDTEGEHVERALLALSQLSNADLVPVLRQQLEVVPPAHRGVLEDMAQRLSARGR